LEDWFAKLEENKHRCLGLIYVTAKK